MDQSLSGGSGAPSRMTLTFICSFRESSNMRCDYSTREFLNPEWTKAKIYVLWCCHASTKKRSGPTCDRNTKPTLDPQPSKERMKIMANHSSATVREQTPHATETTQITISDALRRRAQSVLNDRSIDPQWRAIIRYALETNDPWLADLVRRADAGETIIGTIDFSQTPETNDDSPPEQKIEALAEIICRAGDEPAAALFVLMGALEHSTQPKLLANTAKHVGFTYCGASNLFGMVDAQLSLVEDALLAHNTLTS